MLCILDRLHIFCPTYLLVPPYNLIVFDFLTSRRSLGRKVWVWKVVLEVLPGHWTKLLVCFQGICHHDQTCIHVRTLASKGPGEVANQLSSVYNHGVDNHEDKGANMINLAMYDACINGWELCKDSVKAPIAK
jgi:hypothetical protein